MRTILIEPALNGYICTVGCQKVVFDRLDSLIHQLNEYLKDPALVEKVYLRNALNPMKLAEPPNRTAEQHPVPHPTEQQLVDALRINPQPGMPGVTEQQVTQDVQALRGITR
jgi:hypothetical protein